VKKIFCAGLLLLASCMHRDLKLSDHFDGKRFYNEDREAGKGKGLTAVLRWQFTGERKKWPEFLNDNVKPDFQPELAAGEAAITSINHATEVIQMKGLTVITDPVFSERVSPLSWYGPKRHRPPGATVDELPHIDVVIISHNHYDHLDLESLKALEKKDHPKFIVPLGNAKLLLEEGLRNVIELDWWQRAEVGEGFGITLAPTQHWSARGIFDRSENLWGGYVIEGPQLKIYFAGDTGYNRHFKEVAERFGAMDVSLLPIGAYEPRWFMQDHHMNPEEAVKAHQDLKAKVSVGIHFGTFQLTDEGIDDPPKDLALSLRAAHIDLRHFVAPKNGQTLRYRGVSFE
jgi:L-ascorbate metabolism protein UlaG (beta-lactamase superfamily)